MKMTIKLIGKVFFCSFFMQGQTVFHDSSSFLPFLPSLVVNRIIYFDKNNEGSFLSFKYFLIVAAQVFQVIVLLSIFITLIISHI